METHACSRCEAKLEIGAAFCHECGSPVESSSSEAVEAQPAGPERSNRRLMWGVGAIAIAVVGVAVLVLPNLGGKAELDVFSVTEANSDGSVDLYFVADGVLTDRIEKGVFLSASLSRADTSGQPRSILGIGGEVAVTFQDDGDYVLVLGVPHEWSEALTIFEDNDPFFARYDPETELFSVSSNGQCSIVDSGGDDTRLVRADRCGFVNDNLSVAYGIETDGFETEIEIVDYVSGDEFSGVYEGDVLPTSEVVFIVQRDEGDVSLTVEDWRSGETVYEGHTFNQVYVGPSFGAAAIVMFDDGDGELVAGIIQDGVVTEIGTGSSVAYSVSSAGQMGVVALIDEDETMLYTFELEGPAPTFWGSLDFPILDLAIIEDTKNSQMLILASAFDDEEVIVLAGSPSATPVELELDGSLRWLNVVDDHTLLGVISGFDRDSVMVTIDTELGTVDEIFDAEDIAIIDAFESEKFLVVADDRDDVVYLYSPSSGELEEVFEGSSVFARFGFSGDYVILSDIESDGDVVMGTVDLASFDFLELSDQLNLRSPSWIPSTVSHSFSSQSAHVDAVSAVCDSQGYPYTGFGPNNTFSAGSSGSYVVCVRLDQSAQLEIVALTLDDVDLTMTVSNEDGILQYADDGSYGSDPSVVIDVTAGTYLIEVNPYEPGASIANFRLSVLAQ